MVAQEPIPLRPRTLEEADQAIDQAAFDISCESCKQTPGKPCRSGSNRITSTHVPRKNTAREILAEKGILSEDDYSALRSEAQEKAMEEAMEEAKARAGAQRDANRRDHERLAKRASWFDARPRYRADPPKVEASEYEASEYEELDLTPTGEEVDTTAFALVKDLTPRQAQTSIRYLEGQIECLSKKIATIRKRCTHTPNPPNNEYCYCGAKCASIGGHVLIDQDECGLTCSSQGCNGTMVMRLSPYTGTFYGCSNWPSTKCKVTLSPWRYALLFEQLATK